MGSNDKGYGRRSYRVLHRASDLRYFNVRIRESDLAIGVDQESYTDSLVPLCRKELARLRGGLEDYIACHPEFKTSLVPIHLLPAAPDIARNMAGAALASNVGPMAAVAGAIAQGLGEILSEYVKELIIENGGDICISTRRERVVAVFAGASRFSYRIGIRIQSTPGPIGICTSSGTVGPSLSFGSADAVVIKAATATLADAAASRAGNYVKGAEDLMTGVESVRDIAGIQGVLIIKDDKLAAWGDMEIIPLNK